MNQMELVNALHLKAGLSKEEARRVVKLFFDAVTEELASGGRVEIRGLFSFYTRYYQGYTGRNPKTGEPAQVKPKKMPFFKPGKELKRRVDGGD